ncbi:hypothetical protein [Paenibacillus sp. NAIST15-1]|nr:hypothetical protein [Paenibacillus sp. NAIST15-1]
MNLANRITVIRIGFVPLFILMYQQYPAWMAEQAGNTQETTGIV